ncbi:MAG: glycoside hydrolase family 127 protein [Firmicutes bacterium]|nr:glycoside hydrolase family 127 protein [Bacillota bacterium]
MSQKSIKVTDGFWRAYQDLVTDVVIPFQEDVLHDRVETAAKSGAIQNFRIAAGLEEGDFYGMIFQDSDVAKWLEAVGYVLMNKEDPELEKRADEVIDLIAQAQEPDGYLDTYYIIKDQDKRWSNLRWNHELYCAGHMIEAAVAYYEATGKEKILEVVKKLADHIDTVFGPEEGKLKGYPGHQEIELALVKLYNVTGEERYLNLAKFFIDERGQEPHYYEVEEQMRQEKFGEEPPRQRRPRNREREYAYSQAHKPVREQDVVVGHSVRAMYMLAGMVDIARLTDDQSLIEASKRLWENTVKKQMYVTGGVGSTVHGEAFSFDYDLPNDTVYAETCAAIGLVFFAQRMLNLELKGEYADVMERALYNGVLSGMSQDGKRFFYVNPLEVWPEASDKKNEVRHVRPTRQSWFGCACCPPNLARLIASIGRYAYSIGEKEVATHLFMTSETNIEIDGTNVSINQTTNYPWDEDVVFDIGTDKAAEFTLSIRVPGWCRNAEIYVNDEAIDLSAVVVDGYAKLTRTWNAGDKVRLHLPMPVERVRADVRVRENIGKVALQRGPVVYCLEEVDNGKLLPAICLPKDGEVSVEYSDDIFPGVPLIRAEGYRYVVEESDTLYAAKEPKKEPVSVLAVPYYLWDNREPGEMLVWIKEC